MREGPSPAYHPPDTSTNLCAGERKEGGRVRERGGGRKREKGRKRGKEKGREREEGKEYEIEELKRFMYTCL